MPEMREERRVVTALFADVVGSTALAERLDPEEAKLIVGEAIARTARIVEAYGGTVKDLAGDGLLALFGAPIAHDDDPERALRAGLEIAAAVIDYGIEVERGWGVEGFAVRLGVETGEVVVGEITAGTRTEYGATGDAVNVAARLQANAAPGTVLAGPTTRRLAEDRFVWGDRVELTLKGRSEPVWAATALAPRKGAAAGRHSAPFTGRQAEMGAIRSALSALESGRGGIVFISGEPGIGKSRITSELRQEATSSGVVQWLEGRAVSYGASLAWWPVRDLLRSWVGVGTQEPELRVRLALRRHLDELFAEGASETLPYLSAVLGLTPDPKSAEAMAGLSPEALQFQTYEVIGRLIAALAARRPLVVAIDDLHWADATTLGLFDRLLSLAEIAPVLFFFNHRPETDHPSWALRERAAREFRHLVTVVDLGRLDPNAERALVTALAEGALNEEDEKKIVGFADGNPLYIEELTRAIGERSATASDGFSFPATLEGVILARLDRLEPAWRDLITAASACGRSFSSGLLLSVAGVSEPEMRTAVHNLLRLDLLQEERRWPDVSYRFKHALIQEAAYRTLVASRRHELHARAARWLGERYLESPERVYGLLAHHWMQADDLQNAATFLRLAGEQALHEWALDEAIVHLRSLVAVLRRDGRQAEAAQPLFQLASTLHLAMRYREANDAWLEAASVWRRPAGQSAQPTSELVMGVNRVPWDTNPFHTGFSINLRMSAQFNDSLFVLRPGPSIEPMLAERLEVDATGRRYRVHLQDGLTLNSGRPFTAGRMLEGLKHFLRESDAATILWSVDGAEQLTRVGDAASLGITAIDDKTLEFRLKQAAPEFHIHLTVPTCGGAVPGESSGPFRLAEMTDTRVVIESVPSYPRPRPGNVGRVEWRQMEPEEASWALAEKEIDAVVYNPLFKAGRPGLVEAVGPPVLTVSVYPTWSGPPVDKPLRRALALATDRSRIEEHLTPHQMPATGGLVPPGLPGHTPGIAPQFSPDEARRWLAASSHRGPLRAVHFTETVYPPVLSTFDCWRDVLDIEVEVVPILMKDLEEVAPHVHVVQSNWIAHVPDPGYFLRELTHSAGFGNWVGAADPEVDALIERAETAETGAARMALYHEADRLVVAGHCLIIPVFYQRMFSTLQPWVTNWWEWGVPNQRFSEVQIEPSSPRYGTLTAT